MSKRKAEALGNLVSGRFSAVMQTCFVLSPAIWWKRAVGMLLKLGFASGCLPVCAKYFPSNERFVKPLGQLRNFLEANPSPPSEHKSKERRKTTGGRLCDIRARLF